MQQPDRAGVLGALLGHERELTKKAMEHIRGMGNDSTRDLIEMREVVLDAAKGQLKDEARRFLAAAEYGGPERRAALGVV